MDHQDQHRSYPSPLYTSGMTTAEHDLDLDFDLERDGDGAAAIAKGPSPPASSTRSPTTVFAVSELHGVFRVPDGGAARAQQVARGISVDEDGEEEDSVDDDSDVGRLRLRRQPLLCSFATDGELSTFSDDDDDDTAASDDEGSSSGEEVPCRPRRNARSIFRPVTGIKRRCDLFPPSSSDNEGSEGTPTKKRRASAPALRHANPIGSGDEDGISGSHDRPLLAASFSCASPFKRVRRGGGGVVGLSHASADASTSSFASLFAAGAARIEDEGSSPDWGAAFAIAPRRQRRLELPPPLGGAQVFRTDGEDGP